MTLLRARRQRSSPGTVSDAERSLRTSVAAYSCSIGVPGLSRELFLLLDGDARRRRPLLDPSTAARGFESAASRPAAVYRDEVPRYDRLALRLARQHGPGFTLSLHASTALHHLPREVVDAALASSGAGAAEVASALLDDGFGGVLRDLLELSGALLG